MNKDSRQGDHIFITTASKDSKTKVKPILRKSVLKCPICQQNCWEQSWILFMWGEAVLQSELNLIDNFVSVLEKSQAPGLKL